MNYINDENTQCNENQTRKLVELLQEWGWEVEYGSGTSWEFSSDWERDDFNTAFDKAFNLATAQEIEEAAKADMDALRERDQEKQNYLKDMRFNKAVSTQGHTVYFVNLPLGIRASIHKHGSSWMLSNNRSVKFTSRKKAWQHLKAEWNCAIADLFGYDGKWSDLWYKLEIRMMYPMIEDLLQTWCEKMDKEITSTGQDATEPAPPSPAICRD